MSAREYFFSPAGSSGGGKEGGEVRWLGYSWILFRQPLYRILPDICLQWNTSSCRLRLGSYAPFTLYLSKTSSGPEHFRILNFLFSKVMALLWLITFCLSSLFFIHLVFHLVFLLFLWGLLVNYRSLRQYHPVLLEFRPNQLGLLRIGGKKCWWSRSFRFLEVLTFRTLIQLLMLFISYHLYLFLPGPAPI